MSPQMVIKHSKTESTMSEMKIILNGFNSRLEMVEEKVGECGKKTFVMGDPYNFMLTEDMFLLI